MKLKVKIPKLYAVAIVVLILLGIFIFATWFGLITLSDLIYLYTLLATFIIGWIAVILLAIVGAIFVGMYISHRILTVRGFTPFEKAMLEMKEDINKIKQKLENIEKKL